MIANFVLKIEDGEAKMMNKERFIEVTKTQQDGFYNLTMKKWGKDRSTRQNAYYWGIVMSLISKEVGHTAEELHEIFKKMFLPRKVLVFEGKEYEVVPSTKQLTTKEFNEYLERIIVKASEMGIVIPDPT